MENFDNVEFGGGNGRRWNQTGAGGRPLRHGYQQLPYVPPQGTEINYQPLPAEARNAPPLPSIRETSKQLIDEADAGIRSRGWNFAGEAMIETGMYKRKRVLTIEKASENIELNPKNYLPKKSRSLNYRWTTNLKKHEAEKAVQGIDARDNASLTAFNESMTRLRDAGTAFVNSAHVTDARRAVLGYFGTKFNSFRTNDARLSRLENSLNAASNVLNAIHKAQIAGNVVTHATGNETLGQAVGAAQGARMGGAAYNTATGERPLDLPHGYGLNTAVRLTPALADQFLTPKDSLAYHSLDMNVTIQHTYVINRKVNQLSDRIGARAKVAEAANNLTDILEAATAGGRTALEKLDDPGRAVRHGIRDAIRRDGSDYDSSSSSSSNGPDPRGMNLDEMLRNVTRERRRAEEAANDARRERE